MLFSTFSLFVQYLLFCSSSWPFFLTRRAACYRRRRRRRMTDGVCFSLEMAANDFRDGRRRDAPSSSSSSSSSSHRRRCCTENNAPSRPLKPPTTTATTATTTATTATSATLRQNKEKIESKGKTRKGKFQKKPVGKMTRSSSTTFPTSSSFSSFEFSAPPFREMFSLHIQRRRRRRRVFSFSF